VSGAAWEKTDGKTGERYYEGTIEAYFDGEVALRYGIAIRRNGNKLTENSPDMYISFFDIQEAAE
jgi:hypothetical protein